MLSHHVEYGAKTLQYTKYCHKYSNSIKTFLLLCKSYKNPDIPCGCCAYPKDAYNRRYCAVPADPPKTRQGARRYLVIHKEIYGMKSLRMLFLILAVLVLLAPASGQATDKTGWPTHLRMLTGPSGGQWHMLGEPIAEVITRNVLPTTSRMGGGLTNIAAVNGKNGDMGFTLACFMGAGQSGEEEYTSIVTDNAVLLGNIYPQVLYFLVRRDFAEKHGITSVGSLLARKIPLRFASLKPGTASEFILNLLFKHGYNTSFEELRQQGWDIQFNNYAETADNFVSGELDCFGYTAGTVVPLIKTMEEHTDVVILPVEQDVLNLLAGKFKTGTYTIPTGVYRSVTKPVATLGDYTSIVIRKDLPDSVVYAITKALWENRDYIAGVIKDFGGLSPNTVVPAGLAIHPGAAEFWKQFKK